MAVLSELAVVILEQMEPQRPYDAVELRALAPQLNQEGLREVMRELWIAREVERWGNSGWQRARSRSGEPTHVEGDPAALRVGLKPQDLFDHDSFEGLFK